MSTEISSPRPPRPPLNIWAILLGSVVDITLSSLGAGLILALFARNLMADPSAAPAPLAVLLAFGLAMTLLGGYVAAAVAGHRSLAHGLGVGVLSTLIALLLTLLVGDANLLEYPLWYQVLAYALGLPAGVAGGWVRRRFWGERLSATLQQPGVYPNLKQVIWLALLAILVSSVMIAAVGVPAFLLSLGDRASMPWWTVPAIFASATAGYVLILAWAARKTRAPLREIFPIRMVSAAWLWPGLVTIVGVAILFGELVNLIQRVFPPPTLPIDLVKIFDVSAGSRWTAIAFIVLLGPLAEELLFRGVILRGFLSRYSARKAIFVSALVFGAYHLNPFQVVTATILGVLFAWWRVQTGSLVLPFLGHALNNALALRVPRLPWFNGQEAAAVAATPPFQPIWFDLIGVVLFLVGILQFIRLIRARGREQVPAVSSP